MRTDDIRSRLDVAFAASEPLVRTGQGDYLIDYNPGPPLHPLIDLLVGAVIGCVAGMVIMSFLA